MSPKVSTVQFQRDLEAIRRENAQQAEEERQRNEEIRRQSELLQQILVRMNGLGPQVHPHQALQAPVPLLVNRHNLEVLSMAPMIEEPVFERFCKQKAPTFNRNLDPALIED